MKIGDKVIIVKSDISGVNLGDEGMIYCNYKDELTFGKAFGVAITKQWPQMVSHQKSPTETRVIYFEEKQLKLK